MLSMHPPVFADLTGMEKPRARLRQTTRQRIAAALEIEEAQLRI
jgi:hypothetical protein